MIKRILSYLIVIVGCSSVAILSISFSNSDQKPDALLTVAERPTKITKIKSYGDIEAYGLQNGCVFRIVDETENKDYSLAEFLTEKKEKIPNLEIEVPPVAESGKWYCGKDTPIVTIFYAKDPKKFPPLYTPGNGFMLKRSPIIKT